MQNEKDKLDNPDISSSPWYISQQKQQPLGVG